MEHSKRSLNHAGVNRRALLAGLALAGGAVALTRPAAAQATKAPPVIAGPDPRPKTPSFKAPAGTVDTHTHIFGPNAVYPYAANRSYTPPDMGLVDFAELHTKIGVTRAVIVNATPHGRDNRPVTDAIAVSAGRYKGIGNIDGAMTDKELEALAQAGLCGCRFTFLSRLGGRPDMTEFLRLVDRIKGLGWHVDLYLEPDMIADLTPTLRTLPVPYVIDHMGTISAAGGMEQPAFKALLALQTDEKCWVKITGPERMSVAGAPFLDTVPFARKLIETAPDRVLWGTDWPHPNVKLMPNDGDLVDLVPLFAPDAAVRQKLLVRNPERLYGFAPA